MSQVLMMSNTPEDGDRRIHPRVPITVKGRFLAPDGTEHLCAIRDMSLSGIALIANVTIQPGAHVIVYLDDFGRFEGNVTRVFDGGFAIATSLSGLRRERVAERLSAYAKNGKPTPIADDHRRAFPRYAPQEAGFDSGSMLVTSDGKSAACRIIDMSLGGANLATEFRAPLGTNVSVGRMKGRIVRHTPEGVAIEFTEVPEHATALSRPFG